MSILNSSLKLSSFFEQAKVLIEDNEDKLFIKSIINDLFQQITKIKLKDGIIEYSELFIHIAEYIKLVSYTDPSICEMFISYISKVPVPISFINVIPAMFSMSSKDVIDVLAKQLFEVASSDHNLLIQVLCVLIELPLSKQLSNTIMKLIQNLIQDSNDNDMPSLFRIITKSSGFSSNERTIFMLRQRLSQVSVDDLAIIIEAMLSILPGCKRITQIMIDQLILEEKQRSNSSLNITSKIPISDLSIVLIVLSGISFQASKARQLCYLWLIQNRFPFEILAKLPTLRKENEIWGKLSSCLWNLCIWLLDQTSSSEANEKSISNLHGGNKNISTINAIGKLVDLTSVVYSSYPAMRESIVTILLGRCFPQNEHLEYSEVLSDYSAVHHIETNHNSHYSNRNSDLNKICEIIPLGQALNRLSGGGNKQTNIDSKNKLTNNRNRSIKTILRFSFHKACIAVNILHKLSASYNEVGLTVLNYVISKLLQQVIDVKQVFPKPFILLKLIECAVIGTKQSIQMESSFFILVQKLLSFVNTAASQISNYNFDFLFTNSFSTPSNFKLLKSLHSNVNKSNINLNKINNMVPLQHYTSSTLGLVLASYLLLRNSPMITIQDYQSILNSITKSFSIYQDVSVLYTIDDLSYCLYESHCRCVISFEAMSKDIVINQNSSKFSSTTSKTDPSNTLCNQQQTTLNGNSLDVVQNLNLFQTLYNILNKLLQSGKIIKTFDNFKVGKHHQQLGFRTCFLYAETTFSKIYDEFVSDPLKNSINDCNYNKFIVWDFSGVSSMIVDMAYTLSYITRTAHIQETINEMLDLCNNLFYLVQKKSFSYSLLYNISRSEYHKMFISNSNSSSHNSVPRTAICSEDASSWTHLIRLSFPISDLYKNKSSTRHQRKPSHINKIAEEVVDTDDDHHSVQFLNSTQSCMLLASSWSVAAADAFAGEYVLPVGLTIKSALILSWERALVVSFQSGKCCLDETYVLEDDDVISKNSPSIVRKCLLLFCQLHSTRLMLRAAHSQQALIRTTNKSPTKSKHKVNANKKTNVFPFEHLIGKPSDIRNSTSSWKHKNNENNESLENQEFNAELENVQRHSLQRFLTRSIHELPENHILLCLKYILDWEKCGGSSYYNQSTDKYLTDGGLSLISHFALMIVEKYATEECYGNIAGNSNETDRFVSISSNKINKPNDQSLDLSIINLSDYICNCLLSKLPILLRDIEISRNSSNKIENKILESPHNIELPDLETSLGNPLDRYGKKILILILFKLFEAKLTVMNDFFVIDLANQTQQVLINQIISENTDTLTNVNKIAFTTVGEAKAYLYNALEKELLLQHDSSIETVGLRSLSIILKSSNNIRFKEIHPRIASIAWHLMRNIYTESIDIATHMFHTLYNNHSQSSMDHSRSFSETTSHPGMDDMWPILADLVTNQSIFDQAIAEIASKVTKKTESIVSLMRSCFSTKSDYQSSKPNSDQQHDLQSNAAYRQFWLRWWVSDVSSNRVYGIALLVRDIFRTLFINNSNEIKANRLNKMKSNSLLNIDNEISHKHTSQDFVIDSIPIAAGNKSNSSCSINDVVLGKRNRSMKSPEYLLTNSSMYSSNRSGFPFISKSSIEFHLQISFSLYPSLLILSKPDKNCTSSPYENFIHIVMLITWTLNRFEEILQDRHEYLNLLIKLSSFILKVSKCILSVIECSVNEAIQWRIAQPLVHTNDDTYDHGSIEALKDMISWAILAIKKISSYLNLFRSIIVLSGQFDLPRSLIVLLPSVQALIERTIGRVLHIAKSSSAIEIDMELDVNPNIKIITSKKSKDETIEQIGDKAMYLNMISFLEKHDKVLTGLVDETAFMNPVDDVNINDGECQLSPYLHDDFDEDDDDKDRNYSDDDSDNDQGFVAITSNGGWGLYNHTIDNNDNDDEKSSLNESENYHDSVNVGSSDFNQSEDGYNDSSSDEDVDVGHYISQR